MEIQKVRIESWAAARDFFPALAIGSLAAAWLSGCAAEFACTDWPDREKCPPSITVSTVAEIARVQGKPAELAISVVNLLAGGHPKVELSSRFTPIELENVAVRDGSIQARLADSTQAVCGHPKIEVHVGSYSGETTVRVYSPPVWQNQLTKTYDPVGQQLRALSVFIGKQPGAAQNSLYIGEENDKLGMIRQLAHYLLQGSNFTMPDASLAQNTGVLDSTALFGLTEKAALTYYYDINYSKKVVKATDLASAGTTLNTMLTVQDNTILFASDPQSLLRLAVKGKQMEAFLFDLNSSAVVLDSPTLTNTLSLISARHFEPDEQRRVDAVALDSTNQLQIYSLQPAKGALVLDQELTAAVANFLGSEQLAALELFDLDCDQSVDIVMALKDTTGRVTDIGWLPYIGDGKFGALHKAPLPMPVNGLLNMAIGDLTGDGKPDLALATATTVSVFPNQAP